MSINVKSSAKDETLMLAEDHVRVNPDQIAHEAFNNEILAINLDTGTYYSLTGPSVRLWSLIVGGGASVRSIIDAFLRAHDGDPDIIAKAVQHFLADLESERLIVTDNGSGDRQPEEGMALEKTPFTPFEMRKFTDMQDLLLLDPIHDVEEAGWPFAKQTTIDPPKS